MPFVLFQFWKEVRRFKVKESMHIKNGKFHIQQNSTLCLSSYKSCKLMVKLWWVRARERKKIVFFVPFILSKWNFCTIYLFSKLSDKFSLSLMRECLDVHMSASFVSTCCAVFPNVPSRCGLFKAQHLIEEVR